MFLSSRLPTVWKTAVGYTMFMLDIFFGDIVSVLFVLPLISFVLGSCWLFKSFIEDILKDLRHMNVGKKSHTKSQNESIVIHFCNIVKLYTNVKELCAVTLTIQMTMISASLTVFFLLLKY